MNNIATQPIEGQTYPKRVSQKKKIDFVNDPLVTGEGLDPNLTREQYIEMVRQAIQEGIDSGFVPAEEVEEHFRRLIEHYENE